LCKGRESMNWLTILIVAVVVIVYLFSRGSC
jgi:hypothetical protein